MDVVSGIEVRRVPSAFLASCQGCLGMPFVGEGFYTPSPMDVISGIEVRRVPSAFLASCQGLPMDAVQGIEVRRVPSAFLASCPLGLP